MNIDRILQHAAQRRELHEAAANRRLKASLAVDADRRDRAARQIMAQSFRRAFSSAVAHGFEAERPHEDKSALRPHPSDEGRRPLVSNWPDEGRKVYRKYRARDDLGQRQP